MKEPVDHILRPTLPWRPAEPAITECGFDASKVKTLTRLEYFQRLKDYGSQRAALLTCMTCSSTAGRHKTWDEDPREAIRREVDWETGWRKAEVGNLLRDELQAVAALISMHSVDFQTLLANIRARQEWADKKAAKDQPKKEVRTGKWYPVK